MTKLTAVTTLLAFVLFTNGVNGKNPIVSAVKCVTDGVEVILTEFNQTLFMGTPYIKDHSECKMTLTRDPTKDVHKIKLHLHLNGNEYSPHSVKQTLYTKCGLVMKDKLSNNAGLFQATLILPVSKNKKLESIDDHSELIQCSWEERTNNVRVEVLKVKHNEMLFPVNHVVMFIRNLNNQYVTGSSVGDLLELVIKPVSPANSGNRFDLYKIMSLSALNSDKSEQLTLLENGCLVDNDEDLLGYTSYGENGATVLRFKAFRFALDPVLKFEVSVRMCSSKEAYYAHKCKPDCITKQGPPSLPEKQVVSAVNQVQEKVEKSHFNLHSQTVLLVMNPIFDQVNGVSDGPLDSKEQADSKDVQSKSLVDPYIAGIIVCLDNREVGVVATVLILVTLGVVLSTGTLLFYQVILRQRQRKMYNFKEESLNESKMTMSPTNKLYDINESQNPIMYSWLNNRVITPPPSILEKPTTPPKGPQLQFARKFSTLELTPMQLEKARRNLQHK